MKGAAYSWVVAALLPCLAGTLALGWLSNGVHHDDDLTHYLMARWAHWFPEYLVHVWGRPGATIPMAAVAWIGDREIGWHACRALSAVVTAASALLAARLGARLGVRHAWLIVLACYAQPLNTLLAGTTLTETYTAFYLIAALSLLNAEWIRAASMVFSLALLTRHEAIALAPIWWIALLASPPRHPTWPQRIMAIVLSMWAPATHNLIFFDWFGDWPFRLFLLPTGSTQYMPTAPLSYLPMALQAMTPFVFGLALVGGRDLLRRRHWLLPALAGAFFLIHAVIRWRGVFASGGFARFMVSVAPLVAIAAAIGWERLCERRTVFGRAGSGWLAVAMVWPLALLALEMERRAGRIAVTDKRWVLGAILVAGGMCLMCMLIAAASRRRDRPLIRMAGLTVMVASCIAQLTVQVRPLRLRQAQARVRECAAWIESEGWVDRPIFAANPWFAYFLDLVEDPTVHKGPTLLAAMPVGTLVAWDSLYCPGDYHGVPLETLRDDVTHYAPINRFVDSGEGPHPTDIQVFRKIAPTPPPPEPDRPYPPTLMARHGVIDCYYVRGRDAARVDRKVRRP